MKRTLWSSTWSAACLSLCVANVATAQNALTEPAPGTSDQAPVIVEEEQNTTPVAPAAPENNFGETNIPATNIIRELAPFANGNPGAPRQVETPSGRVTMDAARAIDLTVFFAYDSAQLLPEARVQLDALGRALNDPQLLPYAFLIAGHTDAKGSAAYNLDLSVRRAVSVAQYLVTYHRIAPSRLVAHGWGESQLRLPSDPLSGANRRVEVSLLLPQESGALVPPHTHPNLFAPVHEHRFVYYLDQTAPRQVWTVSYPSRLVDPRYVLRANALDDFYAAPSPIGH